MCASFVWRACAHALATQCRMRVAYPPFLPPPVKKRPKTEGNDMCVATGMDIRDAKRQHWKSKFLYRYRPEGIFRIFFGLILDPPRYICFYSEKRQIHLYRPFFPHGMAFLEKKGGLVPVYVFIFPATQYWQAIVARNFVALEEVGRRVCGTVRLPVWRWGEAMHWQLDSNTPPFCNPLLRAELKVTDLR